MNKLFNIRLFYIVLLLFSNIDLIKTLDSDPDVIIGGKQESNFGEGEGINVTNLSSEDNGTAEPSVECITPRHAGEFEEVQNKIDQVSQTAELHIKHLDLSLLKESVDFTDPIDIIEDVDEEEYPNLYEEDELAYDHYKNHPSNDIGDSEIIIAGYDKGTTIKRSLSYIDLIEHNISNEELNREQLGKSDKNYIICDLNALDSSELDKNLKCVTSNYFGWVIVKPIINNGRYKIGAVIFGNIALPINENIDNRIISFTINERQQIIKIEEVNNNRSTNITYFQQSKETVGNKFFKSKSYHILNNRIWDKYSIYIPFYTIRNETYHILNLNIKANYREIFDIDYNDNTVIYYPNLNKNIFISNVLFGNVKVLFEYNNIYRAVKITTNKKTVYIEIFTVDALGRNNHLLYKRKNILNSNNIFTKVNYLHNGILIYNKLKVLKEAFLIPVNVYIPKRVYTGELWDATKSIKSCTCENKFIINKIFANNIEFCTKCGGNRVDINDHKLPHEKQSNSLIHFSYKNFNQFGSVYVYLNPKLIYTHRIGDIKIGNTILPLNSIGLVVSIKISKYKKDKMIFKFIILEEGRYSYKDYALDPDGETLRLLTRHTINDLLPNWLSNWNVSKFNILADLYLRQTHSDIIRSGFSFENDEVYYYDMEIYQIYNVYVDHKAITSPAPEGLKIARRNVRVIYISENRLITIYTLYLSDKQLPNYKRVVYNVNDNDKYWFIDQEHFLLKEDSTVENISNEYASCLLNNNRMVRSPLNIDLDDSRHINRIAFNINKTKDYIYYNIKPESLPDVKFGNIKIGGMPFRSSGLYDTIGILIQENMRFTSTYALIKPEKKITFFIHDGYKVMVLDYVQVKKIDGLSEIVNLSPYPDINDTAFSIISRYLDNYLKHLKELPFDTAKDQIRNEMEDDCSLLIKLEFSQKYKITSDVIESTTMYQLLSEYTDLLIKEFIKEISYLTEEELEELDTIKYIYYSELNIKNRELLGLKKTEYQ